MCTLNMNLFSNVGYYILGRSRLHIGIKGPYTCIAFTVLAEPISVHVAVMVNRSLPGPGFDPNPESRWRGGWAGVSITQCRLLNLGIQA